MGDVRFSRVFERVQESENPFDVIAELPDADVVAALAGAAASADAEPYLVNVLATEATNRVRRLGVTMDHVGECIVTLDGEGRVRYLNPAAEETIGWSLADARGRDFHALVKHTEVEIHRSLDDLRPRVLPEAECPILEPLRTKEPTHRVDHDVFTRRGGELFIIQFTAVPVLPHGEEEDAAGVVVIFRDDTERVKQEDALLLFRTTVEKAPQGVLWVREDGSFRYVNARAAAALGYSRDELTALSVFDVNPNLDHAKWTDLWARVRADNVVQVETTHRRKDGEVVDVALTVNHVEPEGAGSPFHLVFATALGTRGPPHHVDLDALGS